MGVFKGNPVTLVALFFGAAVFLTGGLYAYFPVAMSDWGLGPAAILSALAFSLMLTLAILARIFYVTARSAARAKAMRGR